MSEQTQYIIRKQSNFANQYGLGETISSGVTLFRAGADWKNYDLTLEEVEAKYRKVTTPVVQK